MNNKKENVVVEKVFEGLSVLFIKYFQIFSMGVKKLNLKDFYFWGYSILIGVMIFNITYHYDFIVILKKVFPQYMAGFIVDFLVGLSWITYFFTFVLVAFFAFVPLLGLREFKNLKKYQKDFDFLSLKAGNGAAPKVIRVIEIDENKTKVIIKSEGVGLDKYQSKLSDLTCALGQIVEDISLCKNPRYISLNLTRKRLPEKISFYELPEVHNKELTFNIGESLGGYETQSLSALPHMLIAGTTGGGKSVFFKQTLLSILKSTEKVQMYLLDLKKGVEMQPFEELPNVKIMQTEQEAVAILEKLKKEMDERFRLIKEEKVKDITLTRKKFDKIIIGVDEASVLYTKVKADAAKKELINRARELTDELAKLSRAAGIHLILATQKVTKETIDTKVQENIGGRMCFRMNTFQGSNTVLGNKMAHELPDIKGRGIWACGNKFVEVQTPFLSEEELEGELAVIASEYKSKKRSIYGKMIEITKSKNTSESLDFEDEGNTNVGA